MPADVTGVAQGPTIRAVLFDIGGPIDTEATLGRQLDVDIRAELTAEGFPVVDDEAYERAWRFAVDSFAPNRSCRRPVWHTSEAHRCVDWAVDGFST